jgi:bifunctional ADP-heptose synthase (sugar kinase/adenylyltransferase)
MFNVLLIGDACEDIYHYGSIDRLCPEAPVPIVRHTHTEVRDGMCLNVRNNLETFGLSVQVLCNPELIQKQRFVDLRTKQHLLRVDFGENERLPACDVAELDNYNFEQLDAVVIADYNKGFVEKDFIEAVTARAAAAKINVFVDSKKCDISPYENCIIKINKLEFNKLKKQPTQCELIVTMGDLGARWNGKTYPTEACDVFDVCGAGDTFLAALVYEQLTTQSIEKGIQFANHCSRLVVGKFGTYTLTSEDVENIRHKGKD